MKKILVAVLALSAVATLPACTGLTPSDRASLEQAVKSAEAAAARAEAAADKMGKKQDKMFKKGLKK